MANEAFGSQNRPEDFALVDDLGWLGSAVLERASFDPMPNGFDIGVADSRTAHGHFAGNHHGEEKTVGWLSRDRRSAALPAAQDVFTRFERKASLSDAGAMAG